MRGVPAEDPSCIHNIDELEQRVEKIGFLPLFAGDVSGFSVEEHTVPEDWWTGDPERDPWEWRILASRRGRVAYGKFFGGRAGFISREWLSVFANYRRDGYDFDARWDDELASRRQKKIMDLFMGENADQELFSNEVKEQAGFGKGGEKNFEGTLTSLEMETYLVCRDFRQRKNKRGQSYGWAIAVLATPEHIFGRELVTAAYSEEPKDSLQKIVDRVKEFYPEAAEKVILKLAGSSGTRTAVKKGQSGGSGEGDSETGWQFRNPDCCEKGATVMNIQIFGTKKSADTRKAERFFKERGIKFQAIDLAQKGFSKGELTSILQAVGGMDDLLDEKTKDREAYLLIKYLADEDKFDKVLEHPLVVKQPVVRNGRQATVGYQPEVWKNWE